MRENNRKPIEKCRKKLPQFTTMNVIDGQAGLVIYSSLIFYSLTIDNILNIIVLLILAGVSIAMLTGENGILSKAQRAKNNTEVAEEKEAIGIAYNGVVIDGEGVDSEKLGNELKKNGYDVETKGNIKVYFKDSKRWYKLSEDGKISEPYASEDEMGTTLVELFIAGKDCTVENCQDETHLHVGDYLLYTPEDTSKKTSQMSDNPLQEQYTGTSEQQVYEVDENMKWRVLGLNEEETQVILISETPIKKQGQDPYLKLQGAEGYIYGEKVLNEICGMYSNSNLGATARSITMEDITNALGITIDKENNTATNSNGVQLKDMEEYQGFFGIPYNYELNNYAPENYMIEHYGEDLKIELTQKKVGDSAKNILDDGYDNSAYMINYTSANVVDPNSKLYEILFEGTTEDKGYAKSYYLASPGVLVHTAASFGLGYVGTGYATVGGNIMFGSYGNRGAFRYSVRPVVILGSNITDGDIEIVRGDENKTPEEEDIWNGITNNSPFEDMGYVTKGKITE